MKNAPKSLKVIQVKPPGKCHPVPPFNLDPNTTATTAITTSSNSGHDYDNDHGTDELYDNHDHDRRKVAFASTLSRKSNVHP